MVIDKTITDVDKIKAAGRFWLGRITNWHEIGPYQIVEYTPRAIDDGSPTQFVGFIDGRDVARIWPTLDRAIVGLIAHRHDGSNTQAGEFFARMVGLPEQEEKL